jgi:hypothetical protein
MRRFIHLAAALAPVLVSSVILPAQAEGNLYIRGGRNHDVNLGCIICDGRSQESINNRFGPHGSPYRIESIFNAYGLYGSPYSNESICNPNAQNPPVVVDDTGEFWGYLTVNPGFEFVNIPGFDFDFEAFLVGLCR